MGFQIEDDSPRKNGSSLLPTPSLPHQKVCVFPKEKDTYNYDKKIIFLFSPATGRHACELKLFFSMEVPSPSTTHNCFFEKNFFPKQKSNYYDIVFSKQKSLSAVCCQCAGEWTT